MKKGSWKEMKLDNLRFFYGKLAAAWEGEDDDRGLQNTKQNVDHS